MSVSLHPLAISEMIAAARRCDRERPGSGERLLDQVDGTLIRIATAPQQGIPYLYATRRFILRRFPYSAVYIARSVRSHLIAIAHHRRRAGYWRRRLGDVRS